MTPYDVTISAVLLTWNSEHHIGQALEALTRELDGIAAEVTVVDNGSTDDSVGIVRRLARGARIIRNASNLGVARARNQGIATSSGR